MEGKKLNKKYVIVSENNSISKPMNRMEALNKAKQYSKDGKQAYIVSEEEGRRIEETGEFRKPEWE